MENPNNYIGTSGWHYQHWDGILYPPEVGEENYTGILLFR